MKKIWIKEAVFLLSTIPCILSYNGFVIPEAFRAGVFATAQASKQVTWILKERSDMQFRHHTRSTDVHAISFRRHNSYRTPHEWEGDTGRGCLSYLHTKEKAKAGQEPSQTER